MHAYAHAWAVNTRRMHTCNTICPRTPSVHTHTMQHAHMCTRMHTRNTCPQGVHTPMHTNTSCIRTLTAMHVHKMHDVRVFMCVHVCTRKMADTRLHIHAEHVCTCTHTAHTHMSAQHTHICDTPKHTHVCMQTPAHTCTHVHTSPHTPTATSGKGTCYGACVWPSPPVHRISREAWGTLLGPWRPPGTPYTGCSGRAGTWHAAPSSRRDDPVGRTTLPEQLARGQRLSCGKVTAIELLLFGLCAGSQSRGQGGKELSPSIAPGGWEPPSVGNRSPRGWMQRFSLVHVTHSVALCKRTRASVGPSPRMA